MQRSFYLLLVLLLPLLVTARQNQDINHFIVKENLTKNGKLAVIATDADENPNEHLSGTYQFVINGFNQELLFNEGVAITPQAIEASVFVFIKHRNENGSHGRLYYVVKNDQGINPIAISWYYLILVPAAFLLVAYLFKRLMVVAIMILIAFFIFNYRKGLDLENIFETIVHGIKELGVGS